VRLLCSSYAKQVTFVGDVELASLLVDPDVAAIEQDAGSVMIG